MHAYADRQTDRQTHKQTHKQTDTQASSLIYIHIYIHTCIYTHVYTKGRRVMHAHGNGASGSMFSEHTNQYPVPHSGSSPSAGVRWVLRAGGMHEGAVCSMSARSTHHACRHMWEEHWPKPWTGWAEHCNGNTNDAVSEAPSCQETSPRRRGNGPQCCLACQGVRHIDGTQGRCRVQMWSPSAGIHRHAFPGPPTLR